MLTQASEPVAAVPATPGGSAPAVAPAPLGTRTIQLVDAMAYAPDAHHGHTMHVRGLLITLPGEQRMTISMFEMVRPSCHE